MNAAVTHTRNHILAAAERLFAELGIDQTSVRQINKAADQRNSSATQYHFGSKANLITTLYQQRMAPINKRQLDILGALDADSIFRELVKALVIPVAEHLTDEAECFYFIRLVAQINSHPQFGEIAQRHGETSVATQRLRRLICARLLHLPGPLAVQRFRTAERQLFNELASYQKARKLSIAGMHSDAALFVSNLLDQLCAQLQAPISAETASELSISERRSA